jgi:uncharacterized protein YdcH (DUF465 family)
MKIIEKSIQVDEFITETRYFAETDDGFDGTAQGYGYKSLEKLNKAYWYFKNRHKLENLKGEARRFLRKNPEIAKMLDDYFSVDNCLYAAKGGETLSIGSLLEDLKRDNLPNREEIIAKLVANKHLWRTLERGVEK